MKNRKVDEAENAAVYSALSRGFCVTKPSIPQYTILDVSDYEVSWEEKRVISYLPPYHHCTEENIKQVALDLLGISYKGPYVNDPLQFIRKIWEIKTSCDKFYIDGDMHACNRLTTVDEDRMKLTCSNKSCRSCVY